MANSSLSVADLDFQGIRSGLVTFLKGQPQFKDYDFDGSNISVLLDVLSYNTYLNNFYTNMAISEMFLDSAQIRDSVVSRAKELNYMPRSTKSAVAYIDIQITPGSSPAFITIPKGTSFNARMDSDILTFTTAEAITVSAADLYKAANVAIYEGSYVVEKFTVNTAQLNQRYILSNPTVDTSSISVRVVNSSSDSSNTEYTQATSLLGLGSDSTVFFVQPADKNKYEVVFGDGVTGKGLLNGNIIEVTYRTSKGTKANGAGNFKAGSTIDGYSTANITVTTNVTAYGGAEPESIDSIKFNAPRHYQTQERAVTNADYETIIRAAYPGVRSISVYGGEKLSPPQYGKVFIAVDFTDFNGVPSVVQNDIESFMQDKVPISIDPMVVAADYTYINVIASVIYNQNATTQRATDIQASVIEAVRTFNETYLDSFNVTFRYSKLAATVDEADPSIISSNVQARAFKIISPEIGTALLSNLDYQFPLTAGSFTSDQFTYAGIISYLVDDSAGNINIVTSTNGVQSNILTNIGTINYTAGTVSINLPALDAYTGEGINLYALPTTNDFGVKNNTVLQIGTQEINVTVTATRE